MSNKARPAVHKRTKSGRARARRRGQQKAERVSKGIARYNASGAGKYADLAACIRSDVSPSGRNLRPAKASDPGIYKGARVMGASHCGPESTGTIRARGPMTVSDNLRREAGD